MAVDNIAIKDAIDVLDKLRPVLNDTMADVDTYKDESEDEAQQDKLQTAWDALDTAYAAVEEAINALGEARI